MTHAGRWLHAWTVSCPGFTRDYCAGELHRLSLGADGANAVILRTLDSGPIAVSRDRERR